MDSLILGSRNILFPHKLLTRTFLSSSQFFPATVFLCVMMLLASHFWSAFLSYLLKLPLPCQHLHQSILLVQQCLPLRQPFIMESPHTSPTLLHAMFPHCTLPIIFLFFLYCSNCTPKIWPRQPFPQQSWLVPIPFYFSNALQHLKVILVKRKADKATNLECQVAQLSLQTGEHLRPTYDCLCCSHQVSHVPDYTNGIKGFKHSTSRVISQVPEQNVEI